MIDVIMRVMLAIVGLTLGGVVRVPVCTKRCQCPPGMDLRTGVRTDGRFECWPAPVAPPGFVGDITEWDGTHGRPERSVQPAGVVMGMICCAPGSRPIVSDWRTVECAP